MRHSSKVTEVKILPASGGRMHRLRKALTALFAGAILTIATVGVVAPAQAEPSLQATATDTTIQSDSGSEIGVQATGYRLRNAGTRRCLRASSSSGAVTTTTCGTSSLQKWTITYEAGRYQIRNVGNGWCLDGNSSSIYTHSCNTGRYQDWYQTGSGSGNRFMNAATGKCLDSNSSGSVYPHSCNTGSNQIWWLN
jgi:hypothetical protein